MNLLNEISFKRRYPGEGNPVISVKTEKVGDGPAAVVGDEIWNEPLQ